MNEDVFEGRWKQWKGDMKRAWGKLTDDDLDRAEGNRDKLMGTLQERYGWAKDEAEGELDRFLKKIRTPAGAR
ncbi:MAG TPA: CsbD family protein [Thermoanaerobaculia bacterium]|nr:CsbD family protein [Thermoanaerobaculia bacterium]